MATDKGLEDVPEGTFILALSGTGIAMRRAVGAGLPLRWLCAGSALAAATPARHPAHRTGAPKRKSLNMPADTHVRYRTDRV
jgi:hypothetical protein